jgi:N-acetylglucosamine kinase-like BadF-type ATPase
MLHRDLVLGIDGGGSTTVAWLGQREGADANVIVGRGVAGGSNLQTQGIEQSLANLAAAIEAAFADAGLTRAPVAAAAAALAGSDRDENRRVFQMWAKEWNLAERFRITHDAEPVLAAGTPGGWGVALIAGTGSFAFARSPEGRTARSGGWGYLFGDEGGGYWIAVEGLRAAAHAADGRSSETLLLAKFMERLGAETPLELVPAVYGLAGDRAAIAALADVVTAAADEGDAAATAILDHAAAELAQTVDAAARGAAIAGAPWPLAVTGGMLLRSARLFELLQRELLVLAPTADKLTRVDEPVLGAVILAQRESGSHGSQGCHG